MRPFRPSDPVLAGRNHRILWAVGIVLALIFFGFLGYLVLFRRPPFEALYLSIATMTTLGDGRAAPVGPVQDLFVAALNLLGVSAGLYSLGIVVTTVIEGDLRNLWGERRLEKDLKRIRDHVVVCGAGRVGLRAAQELEAAGRAVVLVEERPSHVLTLRQRGMRVVEGDATREETLRAANVASAVGLVAALPNDALNLVIVLAARELAPNLVIVARAEDEGAEHRLLRAGAQRVVMPTALGGRRLARVFLKPNSMDFFDSVLANENDLELEEVTVTATGQLQGAQLREFRDRTGSHATVIGIRRATGYLPSPPADYRLVPGDLLLVLGAVEDLRRVASANAERAGAPGS